MSKYKNLYKEPIFYNKDNGILDLPAYFKFYCVKCGNPLRNGSIIPYYSNKPCRKEIFLGEISQRPIHCYGGCEWTCEKLNYCFRCGINKYQNVCICYKWMTEKEFYIQDNLIYDLGEDEEKVQEIKTKYQAWLKKMVQ